MNTKAEFKGKYAELLMDQGCSFDPWDLEMAWRDYQSSGKTYEAWLAREKAV